jgi:hypothetical protein
MTPQMMVTPQMHNTSATSMQASHTLLQSLLQNKGKQVKMPLASTFGIKHQRMMSKDQLLMITKTSGVHKYHQPTDGYLNTLIANN